VTLAYFLLSFDSLGELTSNEARARCGRASGPASRLHESGQKTPEKRQNKVAGDSISGHCGGSLSDSETEVIFTPRKLRFSVFTTARTAYVLFSRRRVKTKSKTRQVNIQLQDSPQASSFKKTANTSCLL
jgi:hypothetical protein